MAKGAKAKEDILKKIQEAFPAAFFHDKVLRIPMQENGEDVEIKVTLTAAKDCVGGVNKLNFSTPVNEGDSSSTELPWDEPRREPVLIGEEEKKNIEDLAKILGF